MTPFQTLSAQGEVARDLSAAGAVHDLGNLIQVASAAINILVRTPGMPTVHAQPLLGRAKASLEEAGAIVQQTISRIRDHIPAVEDTNVMACLTDVAALVGSMDEAGLVIEIDVEPGLPQVKCDPIGLRRAILNLVFNARDAMAGGGIISIEARAMSRSAPGVEIRVADDGVGMSPGTLSRVFDPFFTTKEDGLGGIGLPMVERFVRGAGGDISIGSAPGIGTTVTMRLPAIVRAGFFQQESDQ
ncbi:MAG: ATP-binding protein [Sphingomonas sp.]|jgi:signal transduction histidine kinase|uniref:sensor histidine kinase n=1 Tax=Sphingomonas sp. TaxID=28214 RepID=UPI0035673295